MRVRGLLLPRNGPDRVVTQEALESFAAQARDLPEVHWALVDHQGVIVEWDIKGDQEEAVRLGVGTFSVGEPGRRETHDLVGRLVDDWMATRAERLREAMDADA